MKNSEILIAARAKLATPETWTQGVGARDCMGNATHAGDPDAKCFCTFGAIKAVTGQIVYALPVWQLLNGVAGMNPVAYNDTPGRTHAEVLNMFDRAIALATEAEAA